MNICLRKNWLRTNLMGYYVRLYSSTPQIEQDNYVVIENDTEDEEANKKEISRICNKSRLSIEHQKLISGLPPHSHRDPKCVDHLRVTFNRKMYGRYGDASGVDPVICWPSQQEIAYRLRYENVAFPYTIKEVVERANEKRKQENIQRLERDKEIAEKLAKLDGWKQEILKKIAKKTAEIQAAKLKKQRLIEEVRREFGFTLDPKSEKFQELLTKKAREQKKKEREEKRDAKEKQLIAKLQQQSAEMGK